MSLPGAENWAVLDLAQDPTPGSPEQVLALAEQFRQRAEQAQRHTSRLRKIVIDRAGLQLSGDYAEILDGKLGTLPRDAERLFTAYDACAKALADYARELDQAQAASRAALRQGSQADERYRQLLATFASVVPMRFTGTGLWRGLDAATAAQLSAQHGPSIQQWAVAVGRNAGMCESERQQARGAADQAGYFHRDAAARCAARILAAMPGLPADRSASTAGPTTPGQPTAPGPPPGQRTAPGPTSGQRKAPGPDNPTPQAGQNPQFDAGMQRRPLGGDFRAGVVDPKGLFEAKERAIADRLADEGEMVHPRQRIDNVEGLKNPDAMVRRGPDDPGTVTEFKTLDAGGSSPVRRNILAAGKQLAQEGGGEQVIDGRAVGLTEDDARRGYARALGQHRQHGNPLPDRVRIILGDNRIITLPD